MPRLDKTLADYIAIAISPVLIMLMVGSLMYFLVAVCYHGPYDGRIYWVLGCYTLAIVLITRIAIEETQEKAMLFGAVLVFAVGLAVMTFSNAVLLPWLLLALAWWFAHKLTWDCTLIDEDQDSSGQGLLRIVGFGRKKKDDADKDAVAELEGVTTRVSEMRAEAHPRRKLKGKAHAPGVWIVYFSLAALPLFGLGQLLIPAADVERRQWAFQLLAIYVASGLGLLVTTSFLGLRRYLRQRGIKMPNDMAGVWIGLGAAIIVVLLLLAALLPRPAAEYALSEFPLRFTSPERKSSRYALGNEGADRNHPDSQSHTEAHQEQEPTDGGKPSRAGEQSSGSQQQDQLQHQEADESGESQQEQGESGQASPGQRDSSQQASDPSDRSEREPRDSQQGQRDKQAEGGKTELELDREHSDRPSEDQQSDERSQSRSSESERDQRESSERRPREQTASKDSRQHDTKSRESGSARSTSQSSRPSQPPQPPREPWFRLPRVSISLGGLFKLVLYALFLGIVGYWLWKSRVQVWVAIEQFLRELREFWARLFGKKEQLAEPLVEEEALEKARFRPFSDYTDPFASGLVGRYPPEEIVRYTFEALEAWARENGCPREADQTPREFARQVGSHGRSLAAGVKTLADLYGQVAYASGRLDAKSIGPLDQLWRRLKDYPRTTVGVPGP